MIHYILQVVIFQLLFLVAYEVFLKRETFFTYNRIYLLATPVVAMLLPFLRFPMLQTAIPSEAVLLLPEVFIGQNAPNTLITSSAPASQVADVLNWWIIAYGAGFIFSLGLVFNKFRIIRELFSNQSAGSFSGIRIVEIPHSKIACSFYKTIFLGADLQEKQREQILAHEVVHVRQRHSLDLLFFEILKILFWFNPLLYIYQNRISAQHEYLADAGVIGKVEKQDYFQQLLNSAFQTENISFTNQFFNESILKKRIIMIQKSKSNSISKLKFLFLLPLIVSMLTYVSCSSTREKNTAPVASQTPPPPPPAPVPATPVPEDPGVDDPNILPFAEVEQPPLFPSCEELPTVEQQKDCMASGINHFVNRNFNANFGKELGLTGINRIYVQFKVSEEGNVSILGSRASHPALAAEAERVVSALPKMEPAVHNGKKVAILYSLPIVLNIAEPAPEEEKSKN